MNQRHDMNPSDQPLSRAMRRMAADSPQEPSPELGALLEGEFRRHHTRRRRVRMVTVAALACYVLVIAVLAGKFAPRSAFGTPQTKQTAAAVASEAMPALQAIVPAIPSAPVKPAAEKPKRTARKSAVKAPIDNRFVALPTFDPAIPVEQLQVVRLDMPGTALRLVGLPVSEEISERRVLADVLVTQDGTPYALRLVSSSPANSAKSSLSNLPVRESKP